MFSFIKKLFSVDKPASGERARDEDGKFVPDDPKTPEVNEAYVDGKTPPKKRAPRKKRSTKKPVSK